jgi:hypothetical protein
MAFFLPALGELIMDGIGGVVGSTIATNMTNEIVNSFKPVVGQAIGKEITTYAKNNPTGIIANVLEGTRKPATKAIQNTTTNKTNQNKYKKEMNNKYNMSYHPYDDGDANNSVVPYRPKASVREKVYNVRPSTRSKYQTNYRHSGHTKKGRRAAY